VSDVFHTDDLASLFYRPLSNQAFQELEEITEVIHDNPLSDQNDAWHYCWGKNYSAGSFYAQIHAHIKF
jgi:hypothetical protein